MTLNEFGFDVNDIPGLQSDPNKVEETNYKKWDQGEYATKGIHSFITKDKDNGLPVFVPQKNGDKMVVRFKLVVVKKEEETGETIEVEGPPMSATQEEMRMLVGAYGGNITTLPDGMTSGFLVRAQEETKSKGVVRKAHVRDSGWVSWVEGQNPPVGVLLMWKFVEIWNKLQTTPLHFTTETKQGTNGPYEASTTWAKFVVVGDAWGGKSGYEGYEANVPLNNPYDTEMLDASPVPLMRRGKSNATPKDVLRWWKFISLLCKDEYKNHHWESDPEKSSEGINEKSNPLPIVNKLAKASTRVVVAALETGKTGMIKLDLDALSPYGGQTIDLDKQAEAEQRQPKELLDLVSYIEKTAAPIKVFKDTPKDSPLINIEFTTEGKVWAKQHIVPAWDDLALPLDENGMRYLGKLSAHDLGSLLSHLRGDVKKEETRKLVEDGSPF